MATPSTRPRTQAELLGIIRTSGGATRADLTRLSGLSRGAVNTAVAGLLADGSIRESVLGPKGPGTGSGRPGTRLLPNGGPVAAIDFGHNHVHVAVADTTGTQLGDRRIEIDVDLAAEDAMDAAADLLTELRRTHELDTLDRVVAGIPGPLDVRTGLVRSPTILSGWVGRSPAAELQQRVDVPVHVENDAALGAIGELYSGSGQNHQHLLYVKASHGIGASLVLGGSLYRGGTGLAGEIGHTHLADHAELCRCGNRGCLEAVVSVDSIRQQVAHTHPGQSPDAIPVDEDADAITRRILQESGRILGEALSHLCNLLNPTAVIIGGELGSRNRCFVEGVEEAVRRHTLLAAAQELVVLPAALGTLAELRGGIDLAIRIPTRA